eukprot:TRINITY_DN2404_c2_g1_i2.p1 TRINITY_DN2404_c2_g1~~TRINITY_DN2404_c2_g1_i2.p1  ORF type:complete len:353 (+),score=79.43 TRINITY_DN2404_c2_g1_i2:66-1124(+)
MTTSLTITAADDFHHHFRDGEVLDTTVPLAAKQFRRVLAMPNLKNDFVTTASKAVAYHKRLVEASKGAKVDFIMTLYLTDGTTPKDIEEAFNSGVVKAVKLYPAGATTNSENGITNYESCLPALKKMAELGMVLCVHGESTTCEDIFDREKAFYDDIMGKLIIEKVPNLKVVCEHITTRAAVEFVKKQGPNVGATITAHHLIHNRNDIFKGGIRPHMYCLPILKREDDRKALLEAATDPKNTKFFAGTDSAPHAIGDKESACGCAGIFTAHEAMSFYAEAFESVGALEHLEKFTSINGSALYGIPQNTEKITLVKEPHPVAESFPFGSKDSKPTVVVPLRAGGVCDWVVKQE